MKQILLAAIVALTLTACTDPSGTKKVLAQNQYTNIEIKGYSWFNCSEDDLYKTKFKATAPNGEKVTGTVCKGIFKGKTIRQN